MFPRIRATKRQVYCPERCNLCVLWNPQDRGSISTAEAELGALFLNCKEGKVLRLTLEEMDHLQPPTPVHCDNLTATGIANDAVKK